jgi:hypothetical protein
MSEQQVAQDNSTSINNAPKKEQARRLKCPKGMKLPTAIKAMAALSKGLSTADRNHLMRSFGIAIHEAGVKVKTAAREAANKQRAANKTADTAA